MIWYKNYAINDLLHFAKDTLLTHLDIRLTEIGDNFLVATMPVDVRTAQPARLLHGGASVALAESLGSIASFMSINTSTHIPVGLEINANHISSVQENAGLVTGVCKPIHLGKSTHVWDIQISGPNGKLVCVSRLTVAILDKKP